MFTKLKLFSCLNKTHFRHYTKSLLFNWVCMCALNSSQQAAVLDAIQKNLSDCHNFVMNSIGCGFCYILQMTSVMQSIKSRTTTRSSNAKIPCSNSQKCVRFCFYKLDSQKSASEFIIGKLIRIFPLEKLCKFIRFFHYHISTQSKHYKSLIGVCLCCELFIFWFCAHFSEYSCLICFFSFFLFEIEMNQIKHKMCDWCVCWKEKRNVWNKRHSVRYIFW